MIAPATVRRLLFFAVPIAFGIIAIRLGMDADWDLRNYHYYNAWALLTDRYDKDIAVAQIPSFYNPVIDVPYFLLAERVPARLLAFLLGLLHGLNFILLFRLSERLSPPTSPWQRLASNGFVALAGVLGAVALSEVGTVFYDNLLSLGFFGSLLLALNRWDRLRAAPWPRALLPAILAGLPVGLAFGLKQTSVIYTFGICGGLLLCLPATGPRRLFAAFFCGIGIVAGLAMGGGYWMWHLWHAYGNPLFPMFNQFFQSSWGLIDSYRDTQFLEGSLARRVFYPLVFSVDSRQASEIAFRDFRILAAFLLLPAAGIAALVKRSGRRARALSIHASIRHPRAGACEEIHELSGAGGDARPTPKLFPRQAGQAAFVLAASALSYGVWLQLFALYRYITALEMLAPLLAVLAIGIILPAGRLRTALAHGLLVILVVSARPGNWIRVPFAPRAVSVNVPPLQDPADTIVLLAGHEPLSFLLPAFPPELQFLRIDSTFTNPDQETVRFNQVMRARVAAHQGPLKALFIPTERQDVAKRLGDYGLQLETEGCAAVTSPIGAAPYALCPVRRMTDAR